MKSFADLCLPPSKKKKQASATRALASGTTLQQVIDLVARLTPTVKAPIVLFTYYVRVAFPKSRHAVEARVRVPCLLYDL